jgi:hypothetical protein
MRELRYIPELEEELEDTKEKLAKEIDEFEKARARFENMTKENDEMRQEVEKQLGNIGRKIL